ncbi:MAG: hypothetical protein CML19_09865 [Pusillimonas sp.]|mgnify:CR=1 FL=1|nr:hypothetical protein [Pusillimonas sp.]|tara:strand:- start:144 stop:506 length:363 start_codon:yes stop_codon:yes gene_type:complete
MDKDKTIEKGAGFTQGPWTSDWVGTKPNGSAVVWLGENTNKRIAVIGTGRDEANARLIASAPELFAQCKLFEGLLETLQEERATHELTSLADYEIESHDRVDEKLAQLRELLTKVDGGEG